MVAAVAAQFIAHAFRYAVVVLVVHAAPVAAFALYRSIEVAIITLLTAPLSLLAAAGAAALAAQLLQTCQLSAIQRSREAHRQHMDSLEREYRIFQQEQDRLARDLRRMKLTAVHFIVSERLKGKRDVGEIIARNTGFVLL